MIKGFIVDNMWIVRWIRCEKVSLDQREIILYLNSAFSY
jgi:hypothetical protein